MLKRSGRVQSYHETSSINIRIPRLREHRKRSGKTRIAEGLKRVLWAFLDMIQLLNKWMHSRNCYINKKCTKSSQLKRIHYGLGIRFDAISIDTVKFHFSKKYQSLPQSENDNLTSGWNQRYVEGFTLYRSSVSVVEPG